MAAPYRLTEEPECWIDVEWDAPVRNGLVGRVKIRMLVVLLDADEATAITENFGESEPAIAVLTRLVRDWKADSLVDADGKPLAFDPALFARLVKVVAFRPAFITAYMAALLGQGRAKN